MVIKDLEILKNDSVYIGDINGENNINVFISGKLLNEIDNYLKEDISIERGGVLCGYKIENNNILISDYIKAEYTEATLMELTFTHKTWESINAIKDSRNDDSQIIGWFHSHPGHGVFMSGYDEFIQNNFFEKSYMVSYIFDPVNNERGFFISDDKQIKKLSGFYKINNDTLLKMETQTEKDKPSLSGGKTILIYLSLGLNLVMLILLLVIFTSNQRNNRALEFLKMQVSDLKNMNNVMNLRLDSLKENINLKNINSMEYVIKQGENLKDISMKMMNDSSKYIEIIKLNNLKDENDFKYGQKIKIPLE